MIKVTEVERVTLRDQIAIAALQGMLSHGSHYAYTVVEINREKEVAASLSLCAYLYADAMLEARGDNV